MNIRIFPRFFVARFLALVLAACCLAPPAANAAAAHDADRRLVGIWQDDHDADNIIQFYPDHAVRIYLPKSEGQARNAHWIDGTWTLAGGGKLTMMLRMPENGGMSKVKKLRLTFTRKGFVVKEGGKVVGHQHRISEHTLKQHLW